MNRSTDPDHQDFLAFLGLRNPVSPAPALTTQPNDILPPFQSQTEFKPSDEELDAAIAAMTASSQFQESQAGIAFPSILDDAALLADVQRIICAPDFRTGNISEGMDFNASMNTDASLVQAPPAGQGIDVYVRSSRSLIYAFL